MKNFLTQENKELYATVISRAFDVYVVIPIILLIALFTAGFNSVSYIWTTIFLILLVLFPVVADLYLVYAHKISDWDFSIRKERVKYIFLETVIMMALLSSTLLFQAPLIYKVLALLFFTLEFCYALITYFWKISGHAQLIALLVSFFVVFLGIEYIWIILFIPFIFYSRIILGKHTFMQLLVGFLVSSAVSFLMLKLFGYY